MKISTHISYPVSSLLLLGALSAGAVPANPKLQPVVQPDGSVVMTRLRGDENHHFILTESGLPIERAADGFFYYYQCGEDGQPVLSTQRVGDTADKLNEQRFLATLDRDRLRTAFTKEGEAKSMRKARKNLPPQVSGFPCTGSPRGLVLLIEYSDVAFTVENPNDSFYRMLNEPGYSDLGAWGSARDWFIANSDGRFTPQFDVVGPITLSHPRAYYGANKGGDDVRPEMMIIEACGRIEDQVDFSLYDEDNDGFIDNVFAFYAGYGENLGGAAPSECIWPHSWDIAEATSVPYYFNGKRLNHYACTNEIDLSDTMDGIGTFVHEFSHVMGLPDLYATNYSFAFTPGMWSVMDEGPYNNNSRTPPLYSAFERLSLGWLEPVKIDKASSVKIPPIAENRAYYIATENENEYFLLENRQQTGWDTFLPYHGMLVWHIDYNENIWRYNTVNDRKDHQYVDLIEADNHQNSDTVEGDPFPGANNITSFTDTTEPAMISWGGQFTGVPLTDIYESNGYIYLKACGGKSVVEPVRALEASDIASDSFTANWEADAEETFHYLLNVYTVTELAGGQTSISFAEGYENRDMGSGTASARVENLVPGEEYRYSITVFDPETNLRSVASNEISVALLPPTFDCLTPRALEAAEITHNGFRATWEALDGAEGYLLNLVTKIMGDPEKTPCGFDEGLSALPQGWSTNSRLTYAAADYCGESVPSLRLNAEGQYLEMAAPEGYVRAIEFWMRGIGSVAESRMAIKARVAGEWTDAGELDVADFAEGHTARISAEEIPFGADAVRLVFNPKNKASAAIDDVVLFWGGETEVVAHPVYTAFEAGTGLTLLLEGLDPATEYFYTVRGRQGDLLSKPSNEIRVVTKGNSGIGEITIAGPAGAGTGHAGPRVRINRADNSVVIAGLAPGEAVSICNANGLAAAAKAGSDGNAVAKLPAKGLYIIRTAHHTIKITL